MSDTPPSTQRDEQDAKTWFYLDNRRDIETWAALREDARAFFEKQLLAVVPEVERFAETVDAVVTKVDLDQGSWPRVMLHREAWRHESLQDVSVVLEWERKRLLVPTGANEWPFVAVRIDDAQEDTLRLERLAVLGKALLNHMQGETDEMWPWWRFVEPPPTSVGADPVVLARHAVELLREVWATAAPLLDELHCGA